MLPEGHYCLHWHWSVGIGCKCPAESPTMNLNPWKTWPVISAGGSEQRNISFTFGVNPNLIQGTKQEGTARLYCSKQMEHAERDGKILPFSDQIRMTDCKEQRMTVKSADSVWEKAEEKRKKKNTTGEKSLRGSLRKTSWRQRFWGTETGTLSHGIMVRYKLGAQRQRKRKYQGKDQPVPAAFMQMKTCRSLLNFKALFCPIFSNVAVNPKPERNVKLVSD